MIKIKTRLRRIKNLWRLAAKDPAALSKLEALTIEQLAAVPDDSSAEPAAFFADGTHEEFIEYEKEEQGLKPWYDRIRNL